MVLEIWFEKNGSSNLDFFSGSRKVVDQKKRWSYTVNPHFFSGSRKVVDQKKRWSYNINSHFFQVGEKWLTRKKGGVTI